MNITVLGLWHLGSVTAACCARHFNVTGLDFDETTVASLSQGKAPLLEPGLNELLGSGIAAGRLSFTTDPRKACVAADVLWVCYDTPVNENDESDVNFVLERIRKSVPHLPAGAVVLVSSQLPVGACANLEREFQRHEFASSPENLRLGKAIDAFENAERAIIGTRSDKHRPMLDELFKPFARQRLFMRTESAEMVKHAINSFLALSITFINEIARVCEHVGANAREVSAGLKSEPRIGPRAYLGAGGPFAGGTLARDVVTLTKLGNRHGEDLKLIPAIKQSNDEHRRWALRKIEETLDELSGKTVAILGLVYTPNTDTLRRSAAVELCQALTGRGARVQAFDPAITTLPPELANVALAPDLESAVTGAHLAVVCTEWPQFREANWPDLITRMIRPTIVDANGFLEKALNNVPNLELLSVGKAR